MPTTIIAGIETNYEIVGDGPPLLMFAPGGFDASLEKWSSLGIYARVRLLEHLRARYTCILFDRRECGKSGGRVERIGWDDYAEQGKGLLDHLRIASSHLLGGCMGCCPALRLAVKHRTYVRSMVLYWPVGGAHFRLKGHGRFAVHLALAEQVGLDGVVQLAQRTTAAFGEDPRVGPWASVIRNDAAFAQAYAGMEMDHYRAIVLGMLRILLDRDTAPGAEPEDLMGLDIPAFIVPGKDVAHATSAARYLEECLPAADYWDVLPAEQTEANVPTRILKFLDESG